MTEPGIAVPVLRLSAASTPATAALVYVGDGGIQGLDGPTESLLRALARLGLSVYLLEPRGIGETAPRPGEPGEVSILAEKWIPQHLRMLGTSLGALRAFDLTRGFELVRSETPGVPVMLMSHGFVGWAASLAAALDGQITHLCLDELRPSLEEFATTRTAKVPQAYAMPGILQLADVPELLQAARPHHVLILEPRDALGTPVAEAAWQRRYAPGWHRLELAPQVRCDLDSLKRHAALVDFFAQPPQG
jgi:hypothetical protein